MCNIFVVFVLIVGGGVWRIGGRLSRDVVDIRDRSGGERGCVRGGKSVGIVDIVIVVVCC